jgi:tetratricopeptide (TPR) repeat protein
MRVAAVLLAGCPSPPPPPAADAAAPARSFELLPTQRNPLTATVAVPYGVRSLSARAVIAGPIASTDLEIEIEGDGPGPMPIEIPPLADVTSVSVAGADGWTDTLYLETSRQLLVPIRGHGTIRARYTEKLPAPSYRLPLATYGPIGSVRFEASVPTSTGAILRTAAPSSGVIEVASPAPAALARGVVTVRSAPAAPGLDPVDSLLVIVDRSASRSAEQRRVADLVQILVDALARARGDVPILLAAFDQSLEALYVGRAAELPADALDGLRKGRAMGATDLTLTFAWIAATPPATPYRRALLLTDGRTTAGFDDGRTTEIAKRISAVGVERLDVIALGHSDPALLGRLTLALPKPGFLIDATASLEEIVERLETRPTVPRGAVRVSPDILELDATSADLPPAVDAEAALRDRAEPPPVAGTPKGPVGTKARKAKPPVSGPYADIVRLLGAGKTPEAQVAAVQWMTSSFDDPLAWIAIGRSLDASHDSAIAARAYGSILEHHPRDLALRRGAAMHLEAVADRNAVIAASDAFRRAADQDPGHAPGLRLHAMIRFKLGREDEAMTILERAMRLPSMDIVTAATVREDLLLIAAAWIKREPARKAEINGRVARLGILPKPLESLRFVLHWESDDDADLIVTDGKGRRIAPSADDRDGYGPEQVVVGKATQRAYPYRISVQHGPLARPSHGKVSVIEHDGKGAYDMAEIPFVVTESEGKIDLAPIEGQVGKHH